MRPGGHRRRIVVALAALLFVGGSALYLADGKRYRLYTSEPVALCWRALRLATPDSSSLDLVEVATARTLDDGRIEASIDYRMDRVLGGRTLNVNCRFAAGTLALDSMLFDGLAPDTETLDELRGRLAG